VQKKPFDGGFTSDFKNIEDIEKRIPTIPAEIEFRLPDGKELQKIPTPQKVQEILKSIQGKPDLYAELERHEVDLKEIAHVIAINLYYRDLWESNRQAVVKAKDNKKKVESRSARLKSQT
jgi:hypothetical protein